MPIEPTSPPYTIVCLPPPSPAAVAAVRAAFESRPRIDLSRSADPAVRHFYNAVAIRAAVFVDEQGYPWHEEIDADDARSWHFVAYVPAPAAPDSSALAAAAAATAEEEEEEASNNGPAVPPAKAVATLRLVPGPHGAHPLPGSEDFVGGALLPGQERLPGHANVATAMHDGREPFVALGRVASRAEERGRGLGRAIIRHAMAWARDNARLLQLSGSDGDGVHPSGNGERDAGTEWKDLFVVHAQKRYARIYEKCGYVIDPELGEWREGGVPHVLMWARIAS